MLGWQIALRAAGRDRLLRTHHDRVREAAQQHQQRQHEIHDADTLMIDGSEPLVPQVGHVALQRDPGDDGQNAQDHATRSAHDDRLVEWNRAPGQLAKEIHFSALCDATEARHKGSPDCTTLPTLLKMPLNRSGATAR